MQQEPAAHAGEPRSGADRCGTTASERGRRHGVPGSGSSACASASRRWPAASTSRRCAEADSGSSPGCRFARRHRMNAARDNRAAGRRSRRRARGLSAPARTIARYPRRRRGGVGGRGVPGILPGQAGRRRDGHFAAGRQRHRGDAAAAVARAACARSSRSAFTTRRYFRTARSRPAPPGYVTKASAPDVLVDAVRAVARGELFLSPDIAQTLALQGVSGSDTALAALSTREFEIVRLLAMGHSVRAIAGEAVPQLQDRRQSPVGHPPKTGRAKRRRSWSGSRCRTDCSRCLLSDDRALASRLTGSPPPGQLADRNLGDLLVGVGVDDRDCVRAPAGDVELLAVRRERHVPRALADGDLRRRSCWSPCRSPAPCPCRPTSRTRACRPGARATPLERLPALIRAMTSCVAVSNTLTVSAFSAAT